MSNIEILSPAGNRESLQVAVNAGADAVYLGGNRFSARASAVNFTDEELAEVVDYCNLRNVKVYLAVNTLIKDSEINDFMEYVERLYVMGISALILQDVGVTALVKRYFPSLEIHASTQMTGNSVYDGLFLKELGFSRMVVSRELSTSEIKTIKQQTGMEIEAFVHGALCLCYSGKCYFSSMNGGRSGNRGACAQPCREEYQSSLPDQGKYFLSPKDLNTLADLPAIIDSGVDSLKIEGRMKRPEYVYVVTKNYKQALSERDPQKLEELERQLSKVFNRSFTKGYILQEQGSAIINSQFQKPQGSPVAKVLSWNKKTKRLQLKLSDDLRKGDGLTTGEKVGRILQGKNILEYASSGDIIELDFVRDIPKDTIIYKTYDHGFMKSVEEGMARDKKLPITMEVVLQKGKSPWIRSTFLEENCQALEIQAEWSLEHKIEVAGNLPLTAEKVAHQLSKVGDYPVFVDSLNIDMDKDIHLPIKLLNQLRREVLDRLMEKKKSVFKRNSAGLMPFSMENVVSRKISEQSREYSVAQQIHLSVKLEKEDQLQAVLRYGKDKLKTIYTSNRELYDKAQKIAPSLQVVFCLPAVIKQNDLYQVEELLTKVDRFMTSTMGLAWKYPKQCFRVDYPMNLYNSLSHNYYHDRKIGTTMSIETIYSEKDEHDFIVDKSMVEIPIYLYPRLMTTEYCPHKNEKGVCTEPACKLPDTWIENKKGDRFFFAREMGCKSVIYPQSPVQMTKDRIAYYQRQGYEHFRMEFLREGEREIKQLLELMDYLF